MQRDDSEWFDSEPQAITADSLSASFETETASGVSTKGISSSDSNDETADGSDHPRRSFLKFLPAAVGGSVVATGRGAAASGRHRIVIRGQASQTSYRFGVSGEFTEDQSIEEQDTAEESSVNGVVRCGGWDGYFYTGNVTSFAMDGDATVIIDGDTVDPADLQSDTESRESVADGSGSATASDGFVSVSGESLTVDGSPYASVGANSFWVSYLYWDRDVVDEVMSELRSMGQNTLRIWGFGSGSDLLFQPQPEQYNEAAFERLDYVIKTAREHGIRLVIALGNYWPDFGGIDQYVAWSDSASERTDFYTDPTCKDLYRSYVEHVLTRTNSLTGVQYRNDPTIMLWELLNEARNPAADERDASTLASWFDEMAGYVKGIDPNHLVSTGSEGFSFGPGERYDEIGYWMNTQGSDFVRIHESEHIDVASMHLYPDHWEISSDAAVQFIRDRTREAAETLHKPIYNGEFGKSVERTATTASEQMTVRNNTYRTWYEAMAETGVDGAQFWQLVPNSHASEGDAFTVLAPDDEATLETITDGTAMLRNKPSSHSDS